MNNDYNVTRRHSAVMERLRRRIELFRQHHNSCESRYDGAALERLELERQHTFNLHQRCLQAKAKRTSKHRQPPPTATADQGGARAAAAGGGGGTAGGGTASNATEHTDGTATTAEQSRNSTLIALQETVKRKLESASSPLSRDQVNGFSDGFPPPNKKACRENGANGSPLDSKLGISDALGSNGTHMGGAGESTDGELGSDFQRKEMKQEPDDILPIAPPSGGGNNSLFPDLNEQEWSELMEELNSSVVYEDIQDIFNDGGLYGDRKDPLDAPPAPTLLPPDLSCVKAEFSPASVAFDTDSRTGSPHVRSGQPPLPTSSPAPSPAVPAPTQQQTLPPRPLQAPPPHVMAKDLSPAQQLQQLAAQQQRAQHLHGQMQHKPPQQGAKLHHQGAHPHPQHATAWPPMANASQSPLGGAYVMDKPTSPSLYTQDFNSSAQKQMLMAPNKGSPKGGGGAYLQGPPSHPNMMTHMTQGPPLSHPPPTGAPGGNAMLTFNNTKPLSHFEAGPGPRPPNPSNHNKASLLTLLRQQQQIKQKNSMSYRQHLTHTQQDQNSYPAPPHGAGPTNAMVSAPGGNAMVAQAGGNAMPGNHGNAAYMNSQAAAVAAAIKQQQQQQQQQILEQQKQQQYLQRQQLMAEQEKQQLQRHLTRPPPQYKDQSGPSANQSPFPQQPVSQFTASSQPMGSVGSMGGPTPSSRMFPQNQSLMGMNSNPAAPQGDVGLQACGGGGANVDVLYSSMSVHQGHVHAQSAMQRQQQQLAMSAPYRQNMMQQHLKTPNAATAAIIKQQQQQQQLAVAAAQRHPGSMGVTARQPGAMPGSMGGAMPGGQNAAAWQQLTNQSASSNAFTNQPTAFHVQQRLKMPSGSAPFVTNPATGRPMGGLNQQMMHQRAPPTQQQPTNQSPDMAAFGQNGGRQGLQCNQGYQVSRAANQAQQVSLGYDAAAGSFAEESELVDSLLKAQSAQEWMADLDELLANHR